MGVDSVTTVFGNDIALEPRLDQRGLAITATSTPSTPVALPGEKGDIMTFSVLGANDVRFFLTSSTARVADATSEVVFSQTKEPFLLPSERPSLISVYSPDGDSAVVINCFKRGS